MKKAKMIGMWMVLVVFVMLNSSIAISIIGECPKSVDGKIYCTRSVFNDETLYFQFCRSGTACAGVSSMGYCQDLDCDPGYYCGEVALETTRCELPSYSQVFCSSAGGFWTSPCSTAAGGICEGDCCLSTDDGPDEIGKCDDGSDNDCDGLADCADSDCDSDAACVGVEICYNGLDDDGDGFCDLITSTCTDDSTPGDTDCVAPPPSAHEITIPKIANVYLAKLDVTGTSAVNPKIDIGADGTIDWQYSGTFDSKETTADFTAAMNNYIDNVCTAQLFEDCTVPVSITGDSGSVTIDNIKIQFTDYYWDTETVLSGFNYRMMLVAQEISECGNSRMEAGEQCDDGNLISGDGCSAACLRDVSVCDNDGTCDAGEDNTNCPADCPLPFCGDGTCDATEDCTSCEADCGVCPLPGQLDCIYSTTSCSAPYIEVLRASDSVDAHASLPGQGNFDNYICCKIEGKTLDTTCTDETFLQLSDQTDAHVQEKDAGGFINDACMSVDDGTITCGYSTDCTAYDTCVASISDSTDAHIGNCAAYATKVCCGLGAVAPSLTECSDGTDNDLDGYIDLADSCCDNANDNQEAGPGMACPATVNEVCGDDGITYSNSCYASNACANVECDGACPCTACGDGTCDAGEELSACSDCTVGSVSGFVAVLSNGLGSPFEITLCNNQAPYGTITDLEEGAMACCEWSFEPPNNIYTVTHAVADNPELIFCGNPANAGLCNIYTDKWAYKYDLNCYGHE